jgi:hypothetical protein
MSELSRRLRATIASRVANDMAILVQEVVETALAARDPEPLRMTYRSSPLSRQRSDDYPQSSYQAGSRNDLFGGYSPESDPDEEETLDPQPIRTAPAIEPSRLRAALVTGLRAGAWYLGPRRAGSLLAALAIGVSAGAVALFGGPVLAAGAATVCSLLALTG